MTDIQSRWEELSGRLKGAITLSPSLDALSVGQNVVPGMESSMDGLYALEKALGQSRNAMLNLSERIEALQNTPGQVRERLETAGEQLADRIQQEFALMEDDLENAVAQLEELGERIPGLLKEKWEALGDSAEKLREELLENTEELWKNAVNEVTDEWEDGLQGAVESQVEQFTQMADTARETVEQALLHLRDFAADQLTDTMKEEAEKILEAALSRLKQEVMDGVMTSQLQVQITSAMAPILPSLMVVRAVASAIRQALQILRMGF